MKRSHVLVLAIVPASPRAPTSSSPTTSIGSRRTAEPSPKRASAAVTAQAARLDASKSPTVG